MKGMVRRSAAALVALLALLPLAAGSARADFKLGLQTDATFGNYSLDHSFTNSTSAAAADDSGDAESLLTGDYEWNLNYSAKEGPVSFKGRLRVRDDSGSGLKTHRSYLGWAVSDQLTVEFHPRSFGGPSMGIGEIAGVIGRFSFGDPDAYIGWEDVTLLNVNFNLGATTIGFALADECLVGDCGIVVDSGASQNTASTNPGSMVVHANGAAGPIAWGFQYVSSSAAYRTTTAGPPATDNDTDVSSTGIEVSVLWSGPVKVGFTYVTIDIGCELDAAVSALTCDPTETRMQLGVEAGGLAAAYQVTTVETDFGSPVRTTKAETTNIDVSYAIPIAENVVVGPELRLETAETTADVTGGSTTDTTDKTLVGIAYAAKF